MPWFPWIRLHHWLITLASPFSAFTPAAAWLLLCAILHSPAALLPVTFLLLLGLAESQGSFYLFRTACWRYLRWLPWCHWKGKEKKNNWSQSRLYWEIQLHCNIAVGTRCVTMLLKSVLSRVTKRYRYSVFHHPFLSGESQTKIQLSNASFPASQWLL